MLQKDKQPETYMSTHATIRNTKPRTNECCFRHTKLENGTTASNSMAHVISFISNAFIEALSHLHRLDRGQSAANIISNTCYT